MSECQSKASTHAERCCYKKTNTRTRKGGCVVTIFGVLDLMVGRQDRAQCDLGGDQERGTGDPDLLHTGPLIS